MTELKQYEKGYSPSALQRKYSLSYEQGYELAQDFKRLQEQLDIAKKTLKDVAYLYIYTDKDLSTVANNALKEMEGVK